MLAIISLTISIYITFFNFDFHCNGVPSSAVISLTQDTVASKYWQGIIIKAQVATIFTFIQDYAHKWNVSNTEKFYYSISFFNEFLLIDS